MVLETAIICQTNWCFFKWIECRYKLNSTGAAIRKCYFWIQPNFGAVCARMFRNIITLTVKYFTNGRRLATDIHIIVHIILNLLISATLEQQFNRWEMTSASCLDQRSISFKKISKIRYSSETHGKRNPVYRLNFDRQKSISQFLSV